MNIQPGLKESQLTINNKSLLEAKDINLKSKVNSNGLLRFLVQAPIDKMMKGDQSIRFNIGYRDQDNYPDTENSTLFWKPLWGTPDDYKNSGTFILK